MTTTAGSSSTDGNADARVKVKNLFDDLSPNLPDELFTKLLDAAGLRIERIVFHGQASPDGFCTIKSSTSGSWC